jgi:hypothetical protein
MIRSRRSPATGLLALLVFAPSPCRAGDEKPVRVRFDSPGVLDLSSARRWSLPTDRAPVPVEVLPEDAARRILAAAPLDQDTPPRLLNDGAKAALPKEKGLLASAKGEVRRQGPDLVVVPRSGPPLLFHDFSIQETKTREGDFQRHAYAGRLDRSPLHRVLTDFGHDAPGSFLVSPENGSVAFVHDGGELVAVSPGGERLFEANDLNAPITLVVAALPVTGATVDVVCRVGGTGRATLAAKGWAKDSAFELVLGLGDQGAEKIPVRLERTASGWRQLVPDPRRFAAPDGLACLAGPFRPQVGP